MPQSLPAAAMWGGANNHNQPDAHTGEKAWKLLFGKEGAEEWETVWGHYSRNNKSLFDEGEEGGRKEGGGKEWKGKEGKGKDLWRLKGRGRG